MDFAPFLKIGVPLLVHLPYRDQTLTVCGLLFRDIEGLRPGTGGLFYQASPHPTGNSHTHTQAFFTTPHLILNCPGQNIFHSSLSQMESNRILSDWIKTQDIIKFYLSLLFSESTIYVHIIISSTFTIYSE